MDGKLKVSARGTYILDAEELDQLEGLTLTSVIGEASDALAQEQAAPDDEPDDGDDFLTDSLLGDSTINALLQSSEPAGDTRREAERFSDADDSYEPAGDDAPEELLSPELLFPGSRD